MSQLRFPTSQRVLLVQARGSATQTEFARILGVDRSCLSRYEQEKLGAPVGVLNACLQIVSNKIAESGNETAVQRALSHVRHAAAALEQEVNLPSKKILSINRSRAAPKKR